MNLATVDALGIFGFCQFGSFLFTGPVYFYNYFIFYKLFNFVNIE